MLSDYKQSLNSRFCECTDQHNDLCNMVNSCQIHVCNKFCLRLCKDRKRMYCRCGCGIEKEKDSSITDGFPLINKNIIFFDKNTQIKHLKLKRTTSKRMTQCSKYLLQSWRANCDVQLLIYDSHPDKPNLEEIRRLTNYVVSYTTKVNQSIPNERKVIKEIIANSESKYENEENNIASICKQILNTFHGKRIISRPESMVEILKLPLTICSETIEPINISGATRLVNQEHNNDYSFISKYKNRKDHSDFSLLQFFHLKKNNDKANKKTIIPHPIGRLSSPKFTSNLIPDIEYIKSTLILHKPWKGNEANMFLSKSENHILDMFTTMLNENKFPIAVKNRHITCLKNQKIDIINSTNKYFDLSRYKDFVDTTSCNYEPCTDEDEERYFQFLRTTGKGSRIIDGFNVHVDHEYRWDKQDCIVSTYYNIT